MCELTNYLREKFDIFKRHLSAILRGIQIDYLSYLYQCKFRHESKVRPFLHIKSGVRSRQWCDIYDVGSVSECTVLYGPRLVVLLCAMRG